MRPAYLGAQIALKCRSRARTALMAIGALDNTVPPHTIYM
jgi:hypothetical protein